MSKNIMYDDYFMSPSTWDELKEEQRKLEASSILEDGICGFEVFPLETPMDVLLRAKDPLNTIPEEILSDTSANSGLILSYDGKQECLRICAMPSLLNTAGISGGGVSRVSKVQLATGLTAFLTGARHSSKVLMRAGKVAAVLSNRYQIMPISQMLDVCESLERGFGKMTYRDGMVSHALTVAKFAFEEVADKATSAYELAAKIKKGSKFTPVVEFRASDTSGEASRLITYLQVDDNHYHLIPIGSGVSVIHVQPRETDSSGCRLSCMDKFQVGVADLFSKLLSDIKKQVEAMADTPINHPIASLIGLCRYAGIPQKWGGRAEEAVSTLYGNNPCTFLDLFLELSAVPSYAEADGASLFRILDLEEGICKIINNKSSWTVYDLPGSVSWRVSSNPTT